MISKLVYQELHNMWGSFTIFGNIMSGVIGLVIICKMIITFINTGLNITLLSKTFEWSIKLIAADLFSNVTHHLMHNMYKKQYSSSNCQFETIKIKMHDKESEQLLKSNNRRLSV